MPAPSICLSTNLSRRGFRLRSGRILPFTGTVRTPPILAWEAAVEGVLQDGLLTIDEETTFTRYMDHFRLTQQELDTNGVLTQLAKANALRDIVGAMVPDRHTITGGDRFSLMNSEKLVYLTQDVDH